MAYLWSIHPDAVFSERYPQMINHGIYQHDVDHVRAAITTMWADGPGGWAHEWSQLAYHYAVAGDHLRASLAYGWAKFPVVKGGVRTRAFELQLWHYLQAAPTFGVPFCRDIVTVPHHGEQVAVATHLFGEYGRPVVLMSGGLGAWKMDNHHVAVWLAHSAGVQVLMFDIPGTGETATVPISAPGGIEVADGLIAHARRIGDGRVAHYGISMGGYYAAYSGLTCRVDAAIVQGGPIAAAFSRDNVEGPLLATRHVVGNALGYSTPQHVAGIAMAVNDYSLAPLLAAPHNAPMLILNGSTDHHVLADHLAFHGRDRTDIHLLPGRSAAFSIDDVIPVVVPWLHDRLR